MFIFVPLFCPFFYQDMVAGAEWYELL